MCSLLLSKNCTKTVNLCCPDNGDRLGNSPLNRVTLGLAFPYFECFSRLGISLHHKRLILHGTRVPYPANLIPHRYPFHFQISVGAVISTAECIATQRVDNCYRSYLRFPLLPSVPPLSSPTAQSVSISRAIIKKLRYKVLSERRKSIDK